MTKKYKPTHSKGEINKMIDSYNKRQMDYMRNGIPRRDGLRMVGDGWSPLVLEVYENLSENTHIVQIKEKWGGLRIYIDHGTDADWDLLEDVERRSFEICEVCGKTGKTRTDLPWHLTLCETHYVWKKQNPHKMFPEWVNRIF